MQGKLEATLDIDVTISGDTLLRLNPDGLALLLIAVNEAYSALTDKPNVQASLGAMRNALLEAAHDVEGV